MSAERVTDVRIPPPVRFLSDKAALPRIAQEHRIGGTCERGIPILVVVDRKMNIFSLVEGVILRLGALPGLGFLQSYVHEIRGKQGRIRQHAELYKGYVSTVRGAGAEVAQAARGSKQEEADDGEDAGEEEDADDFETFMQ